MATYSTSLQIKLITDGTESGTWGNSTNTNWNLIEQAVAGVQSITMVNADYTLTVVNGASDEARNAVLVVGGTNSAIRKIVIPAVTKVYVVYNNTSGGYAITIGTSGGSVVTVPNGVATLVYCDATNTYTGISGSSGNFSVPGNLSVTGNETLSGNLTVTGTSTFVGIPAGPTANAGTSTSQLATTSFVTTAVTNATSSLGTMSTQNANNVSITGGTISGLGTPLPVASGGTGTSTITSNNVVLGNGTGAIQVVAPGTSGNVLKSNGTTWVSGAGFTWNVQNVQSNTNSYSIPSNAVLVLGTCYHYMGSNAGSAMSVNIKNSSGSTLYTYVLTGGNENNGGDGGSGMSTRSAWSVAIPSAAQGGTLEFFQSSGSNGFTNTVNQVVLNS